MTSRRDAQDDSAGDRLSEMDRLRDLALYDELTGIPNRRAFLERGKQAFAAARAGGPLFSLVLLDMDGLKDINDTFGYGAGDRALVEFARAITAAVRSDDLAARIGGDEFAVIATHGSAAEAEAFCERLSELSRGIVRTLKPGRSEVIISAGVGQGVWRPDVPSVDALFAIAEEGLASTKAAPSTATEAVGAFRPRGRRALGEELRSLLAIARQVTTSRGMDELLRRVTEQAALLIGAEIATTALTTTEGTVRPTEVWQSGVWQAITFENPLGRGILGRTAASGRPEVHNRLTADALYRADLQAQIELRSALCVPLRDRRGSPLGALALGNKRGEQDFQESDVGLAQAFADLAASAIENVRDFAEAEAARAELRTLMEQAHDALFVVDQASGRLTTVNSAAEALTNYARAELLALTIADLNIVAVDRHEDGGPRPGFDQIRRRDGTLIPVEISVSHAETGGGGQVLIIARDISERLRADKALRDANARLLALAEHAGEAIIRNDLHGVIVNANAMAAQVLGRTRAELSRMRLIDLVDPSDLQTLRDRRSQLEAHGHVRTMMRFFRGDGTSFIAELSASLVGDEVLLIMHDVDERLAREEETRRRNQELEDRNSVAALLAGAQSIAHGLESVLQIISRSCEMSGALVLRENGRSRLEPVASWQVPRALVAFFTREPPVLGEGPAGEALARRTPLIVNDVAAETGARWQKMAEAGVGSVTAMPLVVGDRTLGALLGGNVVSANFSEAQIARLRAFSDQIAVWLNGRLLLEATIERERDTRLLADLGESLNKLRDEPAIITQLAEGVAARFGAAVVVLLAGQADAAWRLATIVDQDRAYAALLTEALGAGEWQSGGGAAERAARGEQAAFYDVSAGELPPSAVRQQLIRLAGLTTYLVAPLNAAGDLLGVLIVGSHGAQAPLTPRHLALAQPIAQHAAIAIANVRAYRDADTSRVFLRAVMDQAGEALFVGDLRRGLVVDANLAAETLTGWNRDQLLQLPPMALIYPEDRPILERASIALHRSGGQAQRAVLRIQRADGSTIPVQASHTLLRLPTGDLVMSVVRDISDELAAQQEREHLVIRVRDEAARARVLLEVADQLTQVESPEAVMESALTACQRLAHVGRAAIYLWDAEEERYHFGAAEGVSEHEQAILRAAPLDPESMPFLVELARGETVLFADRSLMNRHSERPIAEAVGVQAAAVLPLRSGGELIGLIAFEAKDRQAIPAPSHIEMVTGIAQQTATALVAAIIRRRLEEAHDYMQAIMQSAGDGIVVTDVASGLVIDVNARVCEITGFRADQLIGRPMTDLVAPSQRAHSVENLARLRADPPRGTALTPVRRRLAHADGSEVETEIVNRRTAVNGRELFVGLVRDVRARVETERKLRFQSQVLASMREAVVTAGAQGRILSWNTGAEEMFGWTEDEVLGVSAEQRLPDATLSRLRAIAAGLTERDLVAGEVELRHKDGRPIWCAVTLTLMRNAHGLAIGTLAIYRDITAEHATSERLRLFAQIVNEAAEMISVVALNGVISYANPAMHAALRYPPESLIGQQGRELIAMDLLSPEMRALSMRMLRGPWHGEVLLRPADGSRLVARGGVSPLFDEAGAAVALVIVATDVTAAADERLAREALLTRLEQANHTADKRSTELRALADVAGILIARERGSVFPALAQRMMEVGAFDAFTLSLIDPARDELTLRFLEHRLLAAPPALTAMIGRAYPRSNLPSFHEATTRRGPVVFHDGQPHLDPARPMLAAASRDGFSLVIVAPLIFHDELLGGLALFARDDREVPADELRLIQALADQAAAGVHAAGDLRRIQVMRRDAIFRLAQACEARDPETGAHLRQIQTITRALCQELQLPIEEIRELSLAAVLHDIGKITVPEAVLWKPGPLTADERRIVQQHTVRVEEMLGGPEFYHIARLISRHHHERWDGAGYPDGLRGGCIPRVARIVAVADVYDALVNARIYKPAWPVEDAAREILSQAGRQFDPEVVAAFESLWRRDRLPALIADADEADDGPIFLPR